MGRAKEEWMALQERGWDAPEKHVCDECVEDEYLKSLIQSHASAAICDYCGRTSEDEIAAPVESVMQPISDALHAYFADPSSAGIPRENGDWVVDDFFDTPNALLSLPLLCQDDLFDDISGGFHNDAWFACANGYWLGEHQSTTWAWSWQHFEETIKTRTRYFFAGGATSEDAPDVRETRPSELLTRIGRIGATHAHNW